MESIYNPMYKLLISLNEYDDEILVDPKFEMLFKNFRSNLKKVFHGTILISEIQNDEQIMSLYDYIIKPELIEYLYQKITTVWDLSYQIGTLIIKIPKGKNKYESLQKEFNKINQNALDFRWYKSFNEFRNRIIHGGLNLITYYDNKRIKFQIYDNDVEETIEYNDFYNDGQRLIIFADYYFTYYTIQLHNYLCKFFDYVKTQYEQQQSKDINRNTIDEYYKNQIKNIEIANLEKFLKLQNDINSNRDENSKYNFYYR